MSNEPVNILIADDDSALLRLLRKWMESSGYIIESAGDGRQAIAAIETSCPHILIADRDMPHIDGIELCRWLRKQDLPRYVYTIVVTSHCSSDNMVEAFEAGADDFLKKPIDKAELVARQIGIACVGVGVEAQRPRQDRFANRACDATHVL